MAFSQDSDLTALIPDILTFGITSFSDEHARAEADLIRTIRNEWWHKKGIKGGDGIVLPNGVTVDAMQRLLSSVEVRTPTANELGRWR